jgi:hypothetical protein
MEKYNYEEAIISDLKDWITNEDVISELKDLNYEDLFETIYDEAFTIDSITGNGLDYYDTEDNCSKYLAGNIELLYLAARDYCIDDDINTVIKHYEDKSLARYFDSTIRCYLLGDCIDKVLKEIEDGK